jgi:nucleoside-triphosphatase
MIYILSTPIHSGKTTSLIEWSKDKQVSGILTPVRNGRRVFVDVSSGTEFNMEADEGEEPLDIGRFRFSKKGFNKAGSIITEAISKPGWLIIDEIGPLELRGEGFHDTLQTVLSRRTGDIILVVREGLTEEVKDHFGIKGKVISNINQL